MSIRPKIKKAYVASPLGFSEAGRFFYTDELLPKLADIGLTIIDPWVLTPADQIKKVQDMPYGQQQKEAWEKLNIIIGQNNAKGIDESDIIIAVLDGVDVDSGAASEIGYGAGRGKLIEGYRGDFRLSADNVGSIVNLQVEYFIRMKGGEIVVSLDELIQNLRSKYQIKAA